MVSAHVHSRPPRPTRSGSTTSTGSTSATGGSSTSWRASVGSGSCCGHRSTTCTSLSSSPIADICSSQNVQTRPTAVERVSCSAAGRPSQPISQAKPRARTTHTTGTPHASRCRAVSGVVASDDRAGGGAPARARESHSRCTDRGGQLRIYGRMSSSARNQMSRDRQPGHSPRNETGGFGRYNLGF